MFLNFIRSICLSVKTSSIHSVWKREQTLQRKRQSQTFSDVFTEKQSITKHYFIIWQCSRRLAKQFSTHLWKLKHSLHENSNLKWNWGFQGFRAFMRVFFAKTDWFRWIYPWAWSCFQTNTKCQRIWSTFHIISQSKHTIFFSYSYTIASSGLSLEYKSYKYFLFFVARKI